VFIASDAPKPATAVLFAGPGARALRDPFTSERIRIAGGAASIAVPTRGVRMLIVEPS
jgi:hypothetical protein